MDLEEWMKITGYVSRISFSGTEACFEWVNVKKRSGEMVASVVDNYFENCGF